MTCQASYKKPIMYSISLYSLNNPSIWISFTFCICRFSYTVNPDIKYPGELNNQFSNAPVKKLKIKRFLQLNRSFHIWKPMASKSKKITIGLTVKIA